MFSIPTVGYDRHTRSEASHSLERDTHEINHRHTRPQGSRARGGGHSRQMGYRRHRSTDFDLCHQVTSDSRGPTPRDAGNRTTGRPRSPVSGSRRRTHRRVSGWQRRQRHTEFPSRSHTKPRKCFNDTQPPINGSFGRTPGAGKHRPNMISRDRKLQYGGLK